MTRTILQTERLRLREFEAGDVENVRSMFDDAEARRLFREVLAIPDFARRWVDRNLERYRTDGFGLWAVEEKTTGRFVGDCGLTMQELEGRRLLEVGYHMVHAARGRGYATEAARACLNDAFDRLAISEVVSIVGHENAASQKVARRIHPRRESGYMRNGRIVYLYLTSRAEFGARDI